MIIKKIFKKIFNKQKELIKDRSDYKISYDWDEYAQIKKEQFNLDEEGVKKLYTDMLKIMTYVAESYFHLGHENQGYTYIKFINKRK